MWSYQLGLQQGWIPSDPRVAVGACGGGSPASPLQPSMTGGAGSGDFSESVIEANPWPPLTLEPSGVAGNALPTYTTTGTVVTLPPPVFTTASGKTVDGGDGWFDTADTRPIYTPVAVCSYPDAWDANSAAVPAPCPATGAVAATTAAAVIATATATTATDDDVGPVRFARNKIPLPKRTAAPF